MELIKVNAQEYGLQESKAKEIESLYIPMVKMLTEMEKQYNEIIEQDITPELVSDAKRLRIDISKIRINADKARKNAKEEYLRAGNAIQGAYNTLLYAVKSKEENLEKIEKHFENLEKERIAKLQEKRQSELHKYEPEMNVPNLGEMQDDIWNNYINGVKLNYKQRLAAEKKAEKERKEAKRLNNLKIKRENELRDYWRFVPEKHPAFETLSDDEWNDFIAEMNNAYIAHEKEQERIRLENEKMRKEAEAKEKQAEKERKEREAKEKAEREAHQKQLQAEREKQAKLEAELKAKKEAEEKAEAERKAQLQAELKKGDTDKVNDLINDLNSLKTKYEFKSEKYKKMYVSVCELIDKTVNYINK